MLFLLGLLAPNKISPAISIDSAGNIPFYLGMESNPVKILRPSMARKVIGIYRPKWRRRGGIIYLKAAPYWRASITEEAITKAVGAEHLPPDDGRWRTCKHNFKVDEC